MIFIIMEMLNINHIRIFGAPDTLTVSYGGVIASRLIYTDRFAYPFVIGGGKIIIGGASKDHGVFGSKLNRNKDYIAGRIWTNIKSLSGYSILTFWSTESDAKVVDGKLINKLLTKLNIDRERVIFANFNEPLGWEAKVSLYKGGDIVLSEMTPNQEKQYELHLMNAHDKHDATTDFRTIRDNAKYIPREKAAGSMAAYHAMVHTENIKRIVRNVLKEYIYKETKKIIF